MSDNPISSKYHFKKPTAQSMVEFALVLPILLILIFGIIEFGRLFQAWLSVQNSARFAVRYAVTGDYDTSYCNAANYAAAASADAFTWFDVNGNNTHDSGENISLPTSIAAADTYSSDAQDCKIPNKYQIALQSSAPFSGISASKRTQAMTTAIQNMTAALEDYARLESIQHVTRTDAFAISRNPTFDDNPTYEDTPGYFNVVVYSSRVISGGGAVTYADPANGVYWDVSPNEDPGAPGDRVAVAVDFNHPMITPFLMSVWPYVHLTTIREGIIENFRSSKVINVAPSNLLPSSTPSPTYTITLTPSYTPTTTPSETPTLTPSNTPTKTLTPSTTLTPSMTLTPTNTYTPSMTYTTTPAPDCDDITVTMGLKAGTTNILSGTVTNGNFAQIKMDRMYIDWPAPDAGQWLHYVRWNSTTIFGSKWNGDWWPDTDITNKDQYIANGTPANFEIQFDHLDYRGLFGTYTVTFTFNPPSSTCKKVVTYTRDQPSTRTPTPVTPSRTPTPITPSNTPSPITPTRTFTITNTAPTSTRTPITPSATNTPITPSKTNTPITPSKTNTPITPSKTNTPVTPTKTNTPVTPTKTFTKTNTLPPTATNTVAPTNTRTALPTWGGD